MADDRYGIKLPTDLNLNVDLDLDMNTDGNNNSHGMPCHGKERWDKKRIHQCWSWDIWFARRQRSNNQRSLNKCIFGFDPLRNANADVNINFDWCSTLSQTNHNINGNANSKKSMNTSTRTRLMIDGQSVKDSKKPLMHLPSRKGAGVGSASMVKRAPSNSIFQPIVNGRSPKLQGVYSKSNST